jgi:hypothetical protein
MIASKSNFAIYCYLSAAGHLSNPVIGMVVAKDIIITLLKSEAERYYEINLFL